MPLSQEQISLLSNPLTKVVFVEDNPKKPGTKAWERFAKYRQALTICEADFEKGFLKIDGVNMDVDKSQAANKRGAPQGTPDKEPLARSKCPTKDIAPKELLPEQVDQHKQSGNQCGYGGRCSRNDAGRIVRA